MEVLSSDNGVLSNAEVAVLVSDLRASREATKKIPGALRNREIVERKMIQYVSTMSGEYSIEQTERCLMALQQPCSPWNKLEEEEKLQMVNIVPRSTVEFTLCLCNRDCSFDSDEIETILKKVAECFDLNVMQEEGEGEEEEEEADEE